ncbi:MAG: hypothetical protein ACK5N8_02250 [Alphaproteobacteria bacterium]
MVSVKNIQSYPIRYNGQDYQTEEIFDVDEKTAEELLSKKKVENVSPIETLTTEERKAKILKAVKELLISNPAKPSPTVAEVKAKAELNSNVSGAERDEALAHIKAEEGLKNSSDNGKQKEGE